MKRIKFKASQIDATRLAIIYHDQKTSHIHTSHMEYRVPTNEPDLSIDQHELLQSNTLQMPFTKHASKSEHSLSLTLHRNTALYPA